LIASVIETPPSQQSETVMERTTHVPFFALIILALFFLLGGFDAIAQERIEPAYAGRQDRGESTATMPGGAPTLELHR
jgi:hypothetical protein